MNEGASRHRKGRRSSGAGATRARHGVGAGTKAPGAEREPLSSPCPAPSLFPEPRTPCRPTPASLGCPRPSRPRCGRLRTAGNAPATTYTSMTTPRRRWRTHSLLPSRLRARRPRRSPRRRVCAPRGTPGTPRGTSGQAALHAGILADPASTSARLAAGRGARAGFRAIDRTQANGARACAVGVTSDTNQLVSRGTVGLPASAALGSHGRGVLTARARRPVPRLRCRARGGPRF